MGSQESTSRVERLRRSHRWRTGIAAAIAVAVGAGISFVIWPDLQPWLASRSRSAESQPDNAVTPMLRTPGVSQEAVAAAASDVTVVLRGTQSSIADKPLQLILTGTIPGRNPQEGHAFLGTDSLNPQRYAAGAMLANGAIIAEIHERHVVLEREGKRVRLELRGGLPDGTNPLENPLLTVGGASSKPRPAVTTDSITQFIRPLPVYDGQSMVGVEVHAGKRSAAFSRWGLANGDVVTQLNDAPLTDLNQVEQLFSMVMDGQALTATVRKRDGSTARIAIDGSVVQQEMERAALAADSSATSRPSTENF